MDKQVSHHSLNRSALATALKCRGLNQLQLSEVLKVNEKSLSRWLNEGRFPTEHLLDLMTELDLAREEADAILLRPKFKVFFRIKYLGKVPNAIEQQAQEMASTLLKLTFLNSNYRFLAPNASTLDSAGEVANQIRRYTQIKDFSNLEGVILSLAEQGVEVAIVPFEKFGLISSQGNEEAFSVTDEKRCVIFLNASAPESKVLFNLCHELCHLFRPDHKFSKFEESFCNNVASELMYPAEYFKSHKKQIESVLSEGSSEQIISLLHAIKGNLGGELWGIAIKMKKMGLFSQKNQTHKLIEKYTEGTFKSLPNLSEVLFEYFDSSDTYKFEHFWKSVEADKRTDIFLRFFSHIKNSCIVDRFSSRTFSELFKTDEQFARTLITSWKSDFRRKLVSSNDQNSSR